MSPSSRRQFLRAAGVTVAGALGAVGLTTACSRIDLTAAEGGGDLLERLRVTGQVKVGFANEAPYGFINRDGELTGEAPEVAKEIFRRLGVDDFVPALSDFGSLIPGLRAGLFDVIAAGMYITPPRCEQIIFSDPDYNAPEAFLVPRGNPRGLRTLDDLRAQPGLRVGVLLGAVESGYLDKLGLSDLAVTFPDQASGIDGVLAGRADTLFLTAISLRDALGRRPDAPLEVTEPFVPVIDGVEQYGAGGYGFRPGETRLRDAFNAELHELKRSSRLLEIVRPFGFTEAEMTDLTADQLCRPAA
ncbi:ectoine/hydroxyectoine ABC transporter substrate-binding protein EhuB [Longimycelium tulufanense]|uniref:ectoine/hydroxyectoine ABC transporter substrate-binding protein EhuB n=1 Tax=Longimycelium tulufanense TaxID=907463 RepID=UPI001E51F2AA|nr:ectoine/hydroxyectoine ABC transporter substrate-binding protein EhuB [Longimycelium tulufanense]